MSTNWIEVLIGIALVLAGIFTTHIRGAMPGVDPGYPAPLGFRVVLIFFGLLFLGIGIYGLIRS
jgi:hypothetical protein